jgi:hypothetical protein
MARLVRCCLGCVAVALERGVPARSRFFGKDQMVRVLTAQRCENKTKKNETMKATKILGRLIVGCLFACCLTLKLHAQPTLPPPDTNNYDGGTNTPVDYAAIYSNNLASVSCWLHCGITNSDGTPADSMQDYADLQASAFSTTASATAIQQQSVRDEALTWATAMEFQQNSCP